jgi:predicted DNA-binding transcriptional regulator AlpA
MSEILNDPNVELLSVKDVAICYGVAVNTVWVLTRKGIIPKPQKFGGSTRWSRRQILNDIIGKYEQ